MTKTEQSTLAECEARIQQGWTTFIEVGTALAQIRDQRLYRQSHTNFKVYCAERWQYGRGYADRLIGTAELAQKLTPIGVTMQPTHEAQLRPLLGLPLDQAKQAWIKATKETGGRPPTAKLVAQAAAEFRTVPPPDARQSAKSIPVSALNQALEEIFDELCSMEAGLSQGMSYKEVQDQLGSVMEMVEALRTGSFPKPKATPAQAKDKKPPGPKPPPAYTLTINGNSLPVHEYLLLGGISKTPEFEKKGLASFAVNVGTKCGHDCLYCSTGPMLRTHPSFKATGESAFATGYAIVDPKTPERVAKAARTERKRGLIQLCTTTDAWSPEAQRYKLGRRCLEAILAEPRWEVRILTKNAAVQKDFDVVKKHRDRVRVSLSLTATPDKEKVISVVERNASPLSERMAVMREAHQAGLRTYGMLCPLLPGIADGEAQVEEMVRFCFDCGAEEIFAEPVNPRSRGLIYTETALRKHGFTPEAEAIEFIRKEINWSSYVVKLLQTLQKSLRRHGAIDKLRFLLYPKGLTPQDFARIKADDAGVKWLGEVETAAAAAPAVLRASS